jgi:DNA (cytosine-5)-methyltransferase 1
MKVGELFAGIGGASLAVGMVYPDAETAWQADLVNEAVRRRHFPDAAQLVGDVRDVEPWRLPRVDLLTAGFPCTDLSVAGKRKGLDGPASGLYREVLRFTDGLRPERVLMENVPALLHYLRRLSADFRKRGYGLTWTACEAADAGLPHLRRRVFVLAELDRAGRGTVEVDGARRWRPEGLRPWATPTASNPNEGEDPATWEARRALAAAKHGTNGIGEPLGQQVRAWPTPTVCGNNNREGASATSGDGVATAVRDGGAIGSRLSADWVEALMGYPLGWTEPEGGALTRADIPPPVRGRYPVGWDRSEPWPGFDWEPPRTLPDGVKAPGRAARIRGLGNAWAPAQGALALRALLAPAQADLFGGAR